MSGTRAPIAPIVVSLLIGMMLAIVPLPDWAAPLRPAWVAMLVIYWVLHRPDRFGLLGAWLTGLAFDALTGSLLGQHALSLTIVAFISFKLHLRIRLFPMSQQALSVFLMIIVNQFILFWVDGVAGRVTSVDSMWLPALSSAIFWAPMVLVVQRLARRALRSA